MTLPINTTKFWEDRIKDSEKYGDIHHSIYISNMPLWQHIESVHFDILKKETEENDKVLDGGCGYGRCAPLFKNYTGIDFSPDFIRLAKENYPGKSFLEASLYKIPFPTGYFDVAFCISIKAMVIGNMGEEAWDPMLVELTRVANKVILLEYEEPDTYVTY